MDWSWMTVRLTIMDRAVLERDGDVVRLEPRFMAVLIRLALDLGRNVAWSTLYHDAMPPKRRSPGYNDRVLDADQEEELQRKHVQKAIWALRRALEPTRGDAALSLLQTDQGPNPGYRLMLDPHCIDLLQFERLVAESRSLPPTRATAQLEQALTLWRGRPLIDVAHYDWARQRIDHVQDLAREAQQRLLDRYVQTDQLDRALAVGRGLLAQWPDADLASRLRTLSLRAPSMNAVQRAAALGPGNHVVIKVKFGDLLTQDDANLVVGFSDTFETDTTNNFLVSADSLNGQLVNRLWNGDFKLLDKDLRTALRGVPYTSHRRVDKRYGKLRRFEIGTVAPLIHNGRAVFAVAYSQVDQAGVRTTSSREMLLRSLDSLWPQVRHHGQYRPVAVPLVGTGLARVDGLDLVDSIQLTVETFLRCARQGRLADELRIVIHPSHEDEVDIGQVAKLIDDLLT